MRLRFQRPLLVALVSAVSVFGCASPGKQPAQQPVAGDLSSHDCSGTKKSKSAPYREAIRPDDRPDHEMVQAIRVHLISSQDPSFDGSEQTVYAHQDEYGGSGSQSGYFLYTLKSGEKVWAKFDSVDSLKRSGDSWKVTYQGVFRFISGTGRYTNIRGGGSYQGTVTPESGFNETFLCSAQY